MKTILRNLIVGLGITLSALALAAPAKGTGNFRRGDALKAVGAKNDYKTRSVGLASAQNHVKGAKNYKQSRILLIEHEQGGVKKVDLVKAPLDKSKPVTRMTRREANARGLVTQSQAKELARSNDGLLGSKRKVQVESRGLTSSGGSYEFKQTAPGSLKVKQYGRTYRASNITRSVPVTGNTGESASASMKLEK